MDVQHGKVMELRAEHGSWEHATYYAFELRDNTLRVFGEQVQEKRVQLSAEQVNAFFTDADRVKLWDLPSTNYEADSSDDLYHMGVSVHAVKGAQLFYHKVPVGVLVMVPTRKPSKVQHVAFSTFVHLGFRRAAELSGVPIPEFLTTKWKAKNPNLLN